MKAGKFTRLVGSGLLAIGASIVQASFVNVAFAGVPTGQEAVRISDLDLNRSADVARLYKRIRAAAESACGVAELTGTHLQSSSQRHCVEEAIASAVAQVHNAQLSAYHQQETKAPRAAARPGSDGKDSMSGATRPDRD
jgi:UrcA family protein